MIAVRGLVLAGSLAAFLSGTAAAQTAPATEAEPGPATSAEEVRRPPPIQPQGFRSPEEGFAAMAGAARAHDEQRLLRVLGEQARRLVRSGDPAADRAARLRFATAYAEQAEILRPSPDRALLQVGHDRWPLPIPMVRRGGIWRFDAREGVQELVDRRIGRNELDTIEVLREIVRAQDEYARTTGRRGAFSAYARRFFSTPGTHDGLYWPSAAGEPESPLGPLMAAAAGGYGAAPSRGDEPRPFHGYLFRILESQGPSAPGGAMDYVVNGQMIGGFGVIATPARYGVSGIQTFLVSHAGVIYQRNLGPETAQIARSIASFDPEQGWERVAE